MKIRLVKDTFKEFIQKISNFLNKKKNYTTMKIYFVKLRRKFYLKELSKKLDLKTKNLLKMNRIFFAKKLYIMFFKKICESIFESSKQKKKIYDISEYHEISLKTKFIKNLKLFFDISIEDRGRLMRRKICIKFFFTKLKEIYVK